MLQEGEEVVVVAEALLQCSIFKTGGKQLIVSSAALRLMYPIIRNKRLEAR